MGYAMSQPTVVRQVSFFQSLTILFLASWRCCVPSIVVVSGANIDVDEGSSSVTVVEAFPPDNVTTPLREKLRDKYCTTFGSFNDTTNTMTVISARLRVYFFKEAFWQEKAQQFEELTCARVMVEGGDYSPQEMKDDMTGPGLFAGYVADGNLIPDFVKIDGILDLTDRVQAVPELDWFDVLPNGPRQVVAYDNKVYGIPLDGDVIYQVYRNDLIEGGPPQTWNDFVRLAEEFHNQDLNGDGQPDFGVCFSTAYQDIGHQMFWALAAPYLQTEGTNSGMWFDVETFEPTASRPSFRKALELWKRLVLASPYSEFGPSDWNTVQSIMNEGRCALYINYPGPIKQLISAQKSTGLGGGKLQLARLPGVECSQLQQEDSTTTTTCPFAIDGINYAPFYAGGGQCATIRLGDHENNQQQQLLHEVMFDLFAYVADPEVSYWDVANPASLLDPYRTSQVEPLQNKTSKEALAFEHFDWEPSQLDALRRETIFVFNHENGAKDLAVAPFDYQHEATMHNLIQYVEGETSLEETQANIVREWKLVTQRFNLQEHRDEYRKYLGLGSYEESLFRNHEYNYLGDIRWIGLSLAALVMILSTIFAVWVYRNAEYRIIRVSQPPFLYMICFGTFIMGSSIIPLSIDDEIASQDGCNASCMAFPWLLSLGFVITFSALFSKIWRIAKVLQNASKFKRIKVTERDVMIPFATLFTVTVLVLILWTTVGPMMWEREQVSPAESYGRCAMSSTTSKVFAGLILGIDFLSLLLAVYQAYKSRGLSDEFSESAYIGIAIVGWLQLFIVGIPLIFLVGEKTTAAFVVKSGMIFVICTSILCLVFIPKMKLKARDEDPTSVRSTETMRQSLRNSANNRRRGFVVSGPGSQTLPNPGAHASGAYNSSDDGLRFVSVAQYDDPDHAARLERQNIRLEEYISTLKGLLEEHGVPVPARG